MKTLLLTIVVLAVIAGPIIALLPLHQPKPPADPWGDDIK